MDTFDIRQARRDARRRADKTLADWTADAAEHWKAEDGILVNDGGGKFLTTDKDYGDVHLMLDYKTVAGPTAGSTSAAARRSRSGTTPRPAASRTWARIRARADSGTTAPAPPARTRSSWPTSRSASGTTWRSSRSAPGPRSTSTTSSSSTTPSWRTTSTASSRSSPGGRSSSRPTAARSSGGTSTSARSPPTRPTRSSRRRASGFEPIFDGKDLDRLGRAGDQLRGRGRQAPLQVRRGRDDLLRQGTRQLRRPGPVQAPPGRQQRPGDPLPRRGRHRLRRDVRAAGPRRHRAQVRRQARPPAVPRLGLRRRPRRPGYLRPVGEWNFEEVTVTGSRIKVELNGT